MTSWSKNVTIVRQREVNPNWPATITTTITPRADGKMNISASVTITNPVPSSTTAWNYSAFTPTINLIWFDNNSYPNSGAGLTLQTWTAKKLQGGVNITLSGSAVVSAVGASYSGYPQVQIPSHPSAPYFFNAATYDGTVGTETKPGVIQINTTTSGWKTGTVFVNVGGSWKKAKRVWQNVNGVWKGSA